MGRRLIRAGEALRRLVGKPGRRSGVDRRKGLETNSQVAYGRHYEYEGQNPRIPNDRSQRLLAAGPDKRSGKDRRKNK